MVFNPKQDEVIKNINGIYVVDAGAGTGKTYTITKRYLKIIEQDKISPEDILLLTFTKNAAENMKGKIMNKLLETNPEVNIMDAKISTFHAFCNDILSEGCEDAPQYLDIETPLNPNFNLIENPIIEKMFFKRIYTLFKNNHPEYNSEYRIIQDRFSEILSLIKKLLSKGVFPKKEGWLLDGERIILGNKELFSEILNETNRPEIGERGEKQSKLLSKFKTKINSKLYFDLENEFYDDKVVKREIINDAFNEDRSNWINLIHDIYYFYIKESLKENRLNFDFLIMFAFLELYYNKKTREKNSFEYVMIDEFQDTNEMQFMLSLLLMKKPNLCVVGDWKQGIYGFRNATIENIIQFDSKIKYYRELLNKDEIKIPFEVNTVKQEFDINFRSAQKILDFSVHSLYTKGSEKEEINVSELKNNIVKLKANNDFGDEIGFDFFEAENKDNEIEFILSKIQELISSDKKIIENGEKRNVQFKDIAILSRTTGFCLKLQELGLKYNIPINFKGGIELFRTKEAIILLAILRIIANKNDKKGWIAILDYFNYSLGDKKEILDNHQYPKDILDLRNKLLKEKKNLISLISSIFKYFKISTNYSNAIIQTLGEIFSNNLFSLENLIYFIEENIKEKGSYNIDINNSENAIAVQTIHGSKGLEYPIVFIANCNQKQFPSTLSDSDIISLDSASGLRCSKLYNKKGDYSAIFDNWRTDLIKSCAVRDYNEERRLLYVAITRAKQFVYLTASTPSSFFKDLKERVSIEAKEASGKIKIEENISKELKEFNLELPDYKKKGTNYAVHDLMEYTPDENGLGVEYGNKIHKMAENIALGIAIDDGSSEYKKLNNFISSLNKCELKPEIEMTYLLNNNFVNGIIDLLAIYEDRIEIIDYKTDVSKLNHEEYRKQLSIYYYAVSEFYNKPVVAKIFYVTQNEIVDINPLKKDELKKYLK